MNPSLSGLSSTIETPNKRAKPANSSGSIFVMCSISDELLFISNLFLLSFFLRASFTSRRISIWCFVLLYKEFWITQIELAAIFTLLKILWIKNILHYKSMKSRGICNCRYNLFSIYSRNIIIIIGSPIFLI